MPKPILWGRFDRTPLEMMLGVLSLSRQPVAVRFSDNDGDVGILSVMAGQVIGAEDFRTRMSGANAIRELARDPGTAFSVVELSRDAARVNAATAIGKLGDLLAEQGAERGNEPPLESSPDAEPPSGGEVIMRGELSEVAFDEILEILPLSQLRVLVTFARDGAQVGTLTLMSGQILAATAGSLRGIEAFNQLHADHGEVFEVCRLEASHGTENLGSVADLLAGARAASPAPPVSISPPQPPRRDRVLLMQGRFSDFPLQALVVSLEFCRQVVEIEFRGKEKVLHRALVKSGRITAAVSATADGTRAALAAIREDPGSRFLVFRRAGLTVGEPVAAITALVSESAAGMAEPQPIPSLGAADVLAASAHREVEAIRTSLSGIETRLERLSADAAALRAELEAQRKAPDENGLADVLSQIAMVDIRLRRGLERTHARVIKELQTAFNTLGRDRRERTLLWCILAAQCGILVAVVGFGLLAM